MPRSGTTFFTHLINSSTKYSSYKYKDLPFYTTPILWNYFSPFFYGNKKKIERKHGDGLLIDKYSPDSFEELIWKQLIPDYEKNGYWQYLNENSNIKLEKIELFIKKVIHIYKKKDYLSKNNNNVFRINYILNKIPNSKVIIVIRNPLDTAISLSKIHLKFLKIHKKNNLFSEELKYLGHFEFGYYRKLFKLSDNNLKKNGNQVKLYLKKCEELNSFIIRKYLHQIENNKVVVVNYDNLKNFEHLIRLFENLNINQLDMMKNFFEKNFIMKRKKKINLKEYRKCFKSFDLLKKFSII